MVNHLTLLFATCIGSVLGSSSDIYTLYQLQANATLLQLAGNTSIYPTNGQSGKYGWLTSNSGGWTSGFFPGILLKLYNLTGNPYYLDQGRAYTENLASQRFNTGTHDIGFIMMTSFGQLYRLTGDTQARDYLITTANSLSTRFSPIVGCIRSWNSKPPSFEVIVDNLLNLELLWWAAEETGNSTYKAIAASHVAHMSRDAFQPFNAGCTWHLMTYNQDTGALLNRSSTPQGLGLNTVWARGQAWVINGYTIAYRYSKDPAYLTQGMAAAECFMRLVNSCCGLTTPYKLAPLWDFFVTDPSAISVDTSAMFIAAEGILEMSWAIQDSADKARYYAFAKALLDSAEANYLFTTSENNAVLMNGTVTFPVAGVSIVYGDYCEFFPYLLSPPPLPFFSFNCTTPHNAIQYNPYPPQITL